MSIIVNSRISFVFALMKCCFAAFGEQNKIDNDSKCQQVYKSQKIYIGYEKDIDRLFCSMLVFHPQSGNSSDTSLGVRSVALLQVAKWSRRK